MSNAVVSKAGIHCVGDKRNGYSTFLKTINDAERRLSLVKCRDNFGAIDEPLALWPDVPTIGAYTTWDDADYNVVTAYNRIVEAARLNPKIKYWEYFNERDGDYQQQADLYIGLMPRLAAAGLGLCMFNCASGTPKLPSEGGTDIYNHIARATKYAKDHGYNVLLGLHEYVTAGGTIGRYKTLADYLQAQNALIPIAITEWLFETHPGDSAFLAALVQYDQVYMPDSRIIGCATWTLGGGGWGGSNYQNALIPMGEYIASVAPIIVPVPVGYTFSHFLIDGVKNVNKKVAFAMPDHDVEVVAVFEQNGVPVVYRTITVKTTPAGYEAQITQTPAGSQIAVGAEVVIEVKA